MFKLHNQLMLATPELVQAVVGIMTPAQRKELSDHCDEIHNIDDSSIAFEDNTTIWAACNDCLDTNQLPF